MFTRNSAWKTKALPEPATPLFFYRHSTATIVAGIEPDVDVDMTLTQKAGRRYPAQIEYVRKSVKSPDKALPRCRINKLDSFITGNVDPFGARCNCNYSIEITILALAAKVLIARIPCRRSS